MRKKVLVTLCVVSLGVSVLGGCTSPPGLDDTPIAPGEETAYTWGDYYLFESLSEILDSAEIVALVRPQSYRYEVYQPPEITDPDPRVNPMAGMPDPVYTPPPSPFTATSVEVLEVWMGELAPGATIDIYQYGGILDGVVFLEQDVPALKDYMDRDLVVLLNKVDDSDTDWYSLTSGQQGLWALGGSGESARLTLLVMEELPELNPGDPGLVLTVRELKATIAQMG